MKEIFIEIAIAIDINILRSRIANIRKKAIAL